MSNYTHNVYLDGKKIDTVFGQESDAREVRKSLIDHDNYNPAITVRNVWRTVIVIQGNHSGYGYEDESEYNTGDPEEAKQAWVDLKEYRLACPMASYRAIKRRVQA